MSFQCVSKTLNEMVEQGCSACELTIEKLACNDQNRSQAINLLQLYFALLISIRAKYYKDTDLEGILSEKIKSFFSQAFDIKSFISELLDWDYDLVSQPYPATTRYDEYAFNQRLKSSSKQVRVVVSLVKRCIQGAFAGRIEYMRDARTAFNFLKKASFDRPDLLVDSFRQLLSREACLVSKPETRSLVGEVLREFLADFTIKPLDPKYSNGATAEDVNGDLLGKVNHTIVPSSIHDTVETQGLFTWSSWHMWPVEDCGPDELRCTLTWVPKTYKALRLIAKQPNALIIWQQALMAQLYDFICTNPYLRSRIPLRNAEVSRTLVRETSLTGTHASVDQTAASDSIDLKIIDEFPKPLSDLLKSFRASQWQLGHRDSDAIIRQAIQDDTADEILQQCGIVFDPRCGHHVLYGTYKMFAPMGSATTFPVMSLIIAAACKLACLQSDSLDDFVVYGDDVIIRQTALHHFYKIMEDLGFQVNYEKSFAGITRFRESCGMDAFAGVDVTPLRASRTMKPIDTALFDKLRLQRYDSLRALKSLRRRRAVELIKACEPYEEFYNQSVTFGYRFLSAYLWRYRMMPISVFSSKADVGIFSPSPTNFHLPRRRKCMGGDNYVNYIYSAKAVRCNRRKLSSQEEGLDDPWLNVWFYLAHRRAVEAERRASLPIQQRVYYDVHWFNDTPIIAQSLCPAADLRLQIQQTEENGL